MIGRWGLYGDLMRGMRSVGFSADDADKASRIAEQTMRERRDAMIRAAVASGLSIRSVAKVWGVSKSHVHRLVSPDPKRNGTASGDTLTSP
jgi:hypothetical protein